MIKSLPVVLVKVSSLKSSPTSLKSNVFTSGLIGLIRSGAGARAGAGTGRGGLYSCIFCSDIPNTVCIYSRYLTGNLGTW